MQVTVSSRYGETTFESDFTESPALYDRLNSLISRKEIVSEHASRLCEGYRKYGGWKDYHFGWAAFHVAKHDHPERFQGSRPQRITGLEQLHAHLMAATLHLKKPCIVLTIGTITIALKICGSRSKKAGCLSVASSSKYGEGSFYGYVEPDGSFEPKFGTPGGAIELLQFVASDPARLISQIGRESGLCCYCNAPLTQVQSKIAGAGKTCAKNYNVPWPNAARTREIIRDNPEFLTGATDATRWWVKPCVLQAD